jgi:hypothetical protein
MAKRSTAMSLDELRSCENPFSHEWAEKGFSAQRETPSLN